MDRKSQFRFLTRHFFDRLFDKDSASANSDPRGNLYPTLGLLASAGLTLGFLGALSPNFVVFYSMIVTGFVMVSKWNFLFPDKRDYLILGSLPILYRDLFSAKVAALCLYPGLFTVSANTFVTLMAPLGKNGTIWQNLSAHLAGTFGGSLFMALGFAALQGVLISVLPERTFRRISPVVQMVSMALLLMVLLAFPIISAGLGWLEEHGTKAIEGFPFFWFLGVYLLPEDGPDRMFHGFALNALYGLIVAGGISVTTYAIAYRSHARSVLDAMDFYPSGDDPWRLRLTRRMDRLLLRNPVQRACFRFIGSILSRSTRHQVFLAVYLAVGLALGLTSLLSIRPRALFPFEIAPDGMLGLPLTLSFFVVSGLRATFNIPVELEGNWIFQLTEAPDSEGYVAATRKWVAVYGIAPLMLLAATLEFAYWPWRAAVFHLAFESIVSLLLLQLLFFTFRKVPFTCSAYPGRRNVVILGAIYLFGFTTYRSNMVALEGWAAQSPSWALLFFVQGIATLIALSSLRRRQNSTRLIYEEQSEMEILGLGLNK